jgi:hypothetical protein
LKENYGKYTLQNGPQTSASITLTKNTLFVFCGDGSIQFVNADKIPDWGSTQYNWTGILPTVVTTLSDGTLLTAGGKHVTLGYYSNEISVFNVSAFIVEAALMAPESSSPAALTGSELVAAIVVPIVVAVVAAVALTVAIVLRRNKKKRQRERSVVGLEQRYGKWFIPFSDLKFGEQLGQGGSGQVFKGTWKNTSVALKVSMTQANSSVISELALMMHCGHIQMSCNCSDSACTQRLTASFWSLNFATTDHSTTRCLISIDRRFPSHKRSRGC